ncbi:hypothetical protein F4860DRAFT_480993 [Xylaria cubensis]|nr:hypothetical protein F4860DRAFT_480993 [Xylaria cubensis]
MMCQHSTRKSSLNPSERNLFCLNTRGAHQSSGLAVLHLVNMRKADDSKHPRNGTYVVIEPSPPYESIAQLFKASRFVKGTNPRDKVYALLDLAKRPCYSHYMVHLGRQELKPKYQSSVRDV